MLFFRKIFRILVSWASLLFLLALLSGCFEEKSSYSYLMLHPRDLQTNYERCLEGIRASGACSTIRQAHNDFIALIHEREQDPEHFGARILQEQENAIYLKTTFKASLAALASLDHSQAIPNLQKLHLELDQKKSAYQASEEQVKILLSVISATSSI